MSVASILTPVLPQLITGGFAVIAGLGGVVLTQRYNARQRDRERTSAANAKIEAVTQELVEAAGELHLALLAYQPVHNAWQPRLMVLGSAFLEFMAGKQTGGMAIGTARGAQIAVEANQRELLAAQALLAPMRRVMAAATRASLQLPVGPVRDATMRLSEVATEAGQAYGLENLWQRRKATVARAQADTALYAALRDLIDAANAHLHPDTEKRHRWPIKLLIRQHRARDQAAALDATVPAPRNADYDVVPTVDVPPLLRTRTAVQKPNTGRQRRA
ncbi:hypothetical protein [Actinoplanes sp. NPDC048796]|uniref:hypothetical protein n=1 Tax=Actinoplanes sp. NPDC048796 TaxID=3155640 RepID=UPI0033DB9B93